MTSIRTTLLAAGLVLLAARPGAAQDSGPSAAGGSAAAASARPALRAGVLDGEIDLDGRLDDPAWLDAPVASGFIQAEPLEGVPAENDTEVRVLVGADALYVGARLHDSTPSTIEDRLVRRDQEGQYDWFSVQLDPNRDQRTAYLFRVSASNVQGDEYVYDDSRSDGAWDAVWESAVARDEGGWTVELRIPLSQIRYEASDAPQAWGANFVRSRVASNELSYFSLKSQLREGRVSQFGSLEDVRVAGSSRRLEARPYLLSSLHQGPSEAGDPFFDGSRASARLGADLRVGLGSAFSVDATFNPDFGQVEADPAVINLSDVETFLEERRPFFVEDAQILDFSLSGRRDALFYSRRIGRAPQGGSPDEAEFTEVPDAATIGGAAKLTGRTTKGLSIGALAAMTLGESGRAYAPSGGGMSDFLVEPAAQYGVVRLRQDLKGGASQVGGIATAMRRDLPGDGTFEFLTSEAYSAGLDFEHQWSDRAWAVNGFIAGSHVRGDPEALLRIQRASNHYFQRPDATRQRVDSTATSLSGLQWRLQLDRQNGEHWTGGLWLSQLTDGFEVNDLGFASSSERLDAGFRIGYREIEPGDFLRSYDIGLFSFHNWSHEALDDAWSLDSWRRAYKSGTVHLDGRLELLSYWGVNANLSLSPDSYSRTATRGGPVMLDPGSLNANLRFNSDRRRAVSIGGGLEWREGFRGSGGEVGFGGEVQIRPSPRVEIRLEPRWSVETDGAQYVTSTDAVDWEPTYGTRYLFAELERTSLSMETRLNVSVSPKLTFQLFAQPLLSSGDYARYRQLARAGAYEFVDFVPGVLSGSGDGLACVGGSICREVRDDEADEQHLDLDGDGRPDFSLSDRDFNVRSLVGNAVLRWEYRPGSTVFVVWQRRQRGSATLGDFDLGRDLDALWGVPADNVFMVKVNYWLGL
jgi:hypothetical protein